MDVRTALKEAMARLRSARVPSHTLAAELLLMHATGHNRAWLYAHPEEPLTPEQDHDYFALVAQRAGGTPTQYLTGKQEFWGLEFEVTPAVLIPRPETELVVEVALSRAGQKKIERIADVGTGSGCLAVALAKEFPQASIVATDISAAALEVARRNAARHSVANRTEFRQCHLLADFLLSPLAARHSPLSFDLIVSNPPYVGREEAELLPREVREHEPEAALFGGEKGGELYAPLIRQAQALLRPAGILVLELGYNSLPRVFPLLDASPDWTGVSIAHDLAGIPRVISAERT